MIVKLLTERHLEFLSLKGGCTGSPESTLVKCHIVGNHMSRLIYSYQLEQTAAADSGEESRFYLRLSYLLSYVKKHLTSLKGNEHFTLAPSAHSYVRLYVHLIFSLDCVYLSWPVIYKCIIHINFYN